MEFNSSLKERAGYIEEVLKEYMPNEVGFQKTVIEAMNYSLSEKRKTYQS